MIKLKFKSVKKLAAFLCLLYIYIDLYTFTYIQMSKN